MNSPFIALNLAQMDSLTEYDIILKDIIDHISKHWSITLLYFVKLIKFN